jgi:hypothetical protein
MSHGAWLQALFDFFFNHYSKLDGECMAIWHNLIRPVKKNVKNS